MNPTPPANPVIDVVLCWHMHQPDYRRQGVYQKPWTLLHAVKDYTDMAAHLESVENARSVVNFSPVLMEQLLDYPRRIHGLLEGGKSSGDFLLDALFDRATIDQEALLTQLLRVNEARMKDRFPEYARLFGKARTALRCGENLSGQETTDLLVWYFVVWLGESLRQNSFVEDLCNKASGFSISDCHQLLVFISDTVAEILPRYRRLAESGAAELSVTPFSHPILPLLLDFESAREAMPKAPLPEKNYPGGASRCDWHLAESKRIFREVFGVEPAGCWPSEGSVSRASLEILGHHDFRWAASGSQVLSNSLGLFERPQPINPQVNPWLLRGDGMPACFFRDDGMSDLIGFEYSKWPADKAVADFILKIESLLEECLRGGQDEPVLSIIMDGENAWEYYHENGWAFLQGLYIALVNHPGIRLTTFSEVLGRKQPQTLPALCAGSWVHGNFSTWIGSPSKNRAWQLLVGAKQAVDAALEPFAESDQPAWVGDVLRQLAVCEASDWFWWLRDDNQTVDEAAFDSLFRDQLIELYRQIGMAPPDALYRPIAGPPGSVEGEAGPSGAMRRSG